MFSAKTCVIRAKSIVVFASSSHASLPSASGSEPSLRRNRKSSILGGGGRRRSTVRRFAPEAADPPEAEELWRRRRSSFRRRTNYLRLSSQYYSFDSDLGQFNEEDEGDPEEEEAGPGPLVEMRSLGNRCVGVRRQLFAQTPLPRAKSRGPISSRAARNNRCCCGKKLSRNGCRQFRRGTYSTPIGPEEGRVAADETFRDGEHVLPRKREYGTPFSGAKI